MKKQREDKIEGIIKTDLPVYLLEGDNYFLIEEIINILKERIEVCTPLFELKRFSLEETPISDIIAYCRSSSLFTNVKLVIVRGVEKLQKEELSTLSDYFKSPVGSVVLVLIANHIDKRLKLWKEAEEKGWLINLTLDSRKVQRFVYYLFRKHNIKAEEEIIQWLIYIYKDNLGEINEILEKISLIGEGGELTKELIEQFLTQSGEFSIFELVDAISEKKIDTSFQIVQRLLKNKEDPLKIVALLARQIRLLLLTKQKKIDQLNLHPFVVKKLLAQHRNFTINQLTKAYSIICEADRKLKTSRIDPELVLENALLEICS